MGVKGRGLVEEGEKTLILTCMSADSSRFQRDQPGRLAEELGKLFSKNTKTSQSAKNKALIGSSYRRILSLKVRINLKSSRYVSSRLCDDGTWSVFGFFQQRLASVWTSENSNMIRPRRLL